MNRVLLIEDDEDLRQLLSLFLNSENLAVLPHQQVIQDLKSFKYCQPDLILCDFDTIKLINYSLLKNLLLSSVPVPCLPLIGLVDSLDSEVFRYTQKLRATRVLTKPIDFEKLLAAINFHLNQQKFG